MNKKWYAIVSLLIMLPLPLIIAKQAPIDPDAEFERVIYEWSRTFAQVLGLAKQKHFKIPNPEKSMVKAIDAFLNDLDPHSSFLDPKTYKSMLESTSGEFFGIGIIIDNTRKTKDKFCLRSAWEALKQNRLY